MKKILLILLLLSFNKVKAYENEYISIDIPDNYTLNKINEYSYKWENDNNYIAVTLNSNKQSNYDIKNYTKEDINNQKIYIENNINNELKDYNVKVEVTDIKKIKQGDLYILNYSIYWPTKEKLGYDTYQIGNIYTTENYITTIIYSSNKEIKNDSEYTNIINSLKIKDDIVKRRVSVSFTLAIILGLSLAILNIIRKRRKKKLQ